MLLPDGGVAFDRDDDTIRDADEGRAERVDTDRDGLPDYRDLDTDSDGRPDREEAGDLDLSTPPTDVDDDGVPDFRDLDSDGNGIDDGREPDGDLDDDGADDFRDLDDDGDGLSDAFEIGPDSGAARNWDDDGLPDHRDPDSDDDTIADLAEGVFDTDGDGIPDRHDDDSDDDGVRDEDEAGDADLATPPVDSDRDGAPDFRDPDSDNDGLGDGDEARRGTSRTHADSDEDGASDLVEVALETDPLDPGDNPRARGNFVFEVPYEGSPVPEVDTLRFRTDVQLADVYFLFDRTTSMDEEIVGVRDTVVDLLEALACEDAGIVCAGDDECAAGEICSTAGRCIEDPAGGCIASLHTGAGYYGGSSGTTPIGNAASIQADAAQTEARIRSQIPVPLIPYGGDETLFQAIECMAEPAACPEGRLSTVDPCASDGTGCPGFRRDALRILVAITDEEDDPRNDGAFTAATAGDALVAAGMVFVGVDADAETLEERGAGRDDLEAVARRSNSRRGDGSLLVYAGDRAAVAGAVQEALVEITSSRPLRVTIVASDVDEGAVDFLQRLAIQVEGEGCTSRGSPGDLNDDGFLDTFAALVPGTPVCWEVVPRRNVSVPATSAPQLFEARLEVRGDGSPLDSRRVLFVVPPEIDVF